VEPTSSSQITDQHSSTIAMPVYNRNTDLGYGCTHSLATGGSLFSCTKLKIKSSVLRMSVQEVGWLFIPDLAKAPLVLIHININSAPIIELLLARWGVPELISMLLIYLTVI
jgi:hypothetical protein